MMKKFLLSILLVVGIVSTWYLLSLRAVKSSEQIDVQFIVQKGMSVQAVAQELQEQRLIRSPLAFSTYLTLHGLRRLLYPGTVALRRSMSTQEIIQVLTTASDATMNVVIPEGSTVQDIDILLAQKGLIQSGAILTCANRCVFAPFPFIQAQGERLTRGGRVEGYLFPDTYNVLAEGVDPEQFLGRMLENFLGKVIEGLSKELTGQRHTLDEVIIMASLIEKEAGRENERAMISGILWNRIERGIPLGVDASTVYMTNRSSITSADLQTNSPYNLRMRKGLPPGPIGNPGIASIRAALHPETSEFLYYLHGIDGNIHYARTNEEHNENRRKYLR